MSGTNLKIYFNNYSLATHDQAGSNLGNMTLSTPGLDNTRLFIGFTAGAGTRCMSVLSSSPAPFINNLTAAEGSP